MSIFSRILYAVKETDPRRAAAMKKVGALAKACDASLELFHAISAPLFQIVSVWSSRLPTSFASRRMPMPAIVRSAATSPSIV